MANNPFQLVMKNGPNPGKVFSLSKSEIHLGRDISNDIVVNDAEVSRKHARLTYHEGQYILEDLGSTNGTFVNGVRISMPHALQPGETCQLGEHVVLVFESSQYDPDATIASDQGLPERPYPQPAPRPAPNSAYQELAESTYTSKAAAQSRLSGNNRILIFGGIGCLLLFVCAIVPGLFLWWIDSQYLWCDFFSFLPGCTP